MIFLFGFGKKTQNYVITKSLYEQQQSSNSLYDLKQNLSPKGVQKIYTTFVTPEPFLIDMPLKDKTANQSKKLAMELTISPSQADELILSKKLKCELVITNKQLWLTGAAKKVGVKIKVYV